MHYSDFSDFWKFVSHGSAATQLKCGGILNNYFIANWPQYVPVKEFWKSVNIRRRYGKWQTGTFFCDMVRHSLISVPTRQKSSQNKGCSIRLQGTIFLPQDKNITHPDDGGTERGPGGWWNGFCRGASGVVAPLQYGGLGLRHIKFFKNFNVAVAHYYFAMYNAFLYAVRCWF